MGSRTKPTTNTIKFFIKSKGKNYGRVQETANQNSNSLRTRTKRKHCLQSDIWRILNTQTDLRKRCIVAKKKMLVNIQEETTLFDFISNENKEES